jgi:hypothetical protein
MKKKWHLDVECVIDPTVSTGTVEAFYEFFVTNKRLVVWISNKTHCKPDQICGISYLLGASTIILNIFSGWDCAIL